MVDVHHGLVVALTAVDRERAHAVLAHAGDGHRVAGVVAIKSDGHFMILRSREDLAL